MLGSKIVGVNDLGIEAVLERLRLVVPHANESRFKKFSGFYLHLPGLLYGLGITDNPDKVTFKVQKGEDEIEIELINMDQ